MALGRSRAACKIRSRGEGVVAWCWPLNTGVSWHGRLPLMHGVHGQGSGLRAGAHKCAPTACSAPCQWCPSRGTGCNCPRLTWQHMAQPHCMQAQSSHGGVHACLCACGGGGGATGHTVMLCFVAIVATVVVTFASFTGLHGPSSPGVVLFAGPPFFPPGCLAGHSRAEGLYACTSHMLPPAVRKHGCVARAYMYMRAVAISSRPSSTHNTGAIR